MTEDTLTGAIIGDTKDWTWVLQRPCPDCGLDTSTVKPTDVPALTRANAAAWQPILIGLGAAARPDPGTWSPLEYGCHVRDVFRLFACRLGLMLTRDDPLFPNWDQDETAVADRYGQQDPARVAAELAAAGDALAAAFAAVDVRQWQRPGRRGDGAVFTVETFARYFIHDPVHHLWDAAGVRYVKRDCWLQRARRSRSREITPGYQKALTVRPR